MARRNRPNLYRMLATRAMLACPGGTFPCPDGRCVTNSADCGIFTNPSVFKPVTLSVGLEPKPGARQVFVAGQPQGVVCLETSDPDWLVCIYCANSQDFPYGPSCIYYPWKWPESDPGNRFTTTTRRRKRNSAGAAAVSFMQSMQGCGPVQASIGPGAAPIGISANPRPRATPRRRYARTRSMLGL